MYDDITIFYNSGKNMIYCFWILSTFGVVSLVVLGFFVYVYGTKMSGSLYLNPFRKKKKLTPNVFGFATLDLKKSVISVITLNQHSNYIGGKYLENQIYPQ